MNYLKSLFAKDRWKMMRLERYSRKDNGIVVFTVLYMKNQYSGKLRQEKLQGEWRASDFPGNIYRGMKSGY